MKAPTASSTMTTPDEVVDQVDHLSSLPAEERSAYWNALTEAQRVAILPLLSPEVHRPIVEGTNIEVLTSLASQLEVRDAADMIDRLDTERASCVLDDLDQQTGEQINLRLDYPSDSAMRWMTPAISVRADWTLAEVKAHLRTNKDALSGYSTAVMVTDEHYCFVGKLSIASLIIHPLEDPVTLHMDTEAVTLRDSASEGDVVELFADRRVVNVPVVDEHGRLLGRVTVDDALHLTAQLADDQFMKRDGLDHETDLFATRVVSFRKRTVWLAINLLTVFFAAWVISFFQDTVQQIVALAVLMPIVSSMGGIAGSQTLTLIIRALSREQIKASNISWIFRKELAVGCLHGVTWAVVVGAVTVFWFDSVVLGIVIAVALLFNLLCAAASGVAVPMLLKRIGQDPALAGSVLLTTVTDVVGFFAFLGLASWWMA
jgi:magnesium transporter